MNSCTRRVGHLTTFSSSTAELSIPAYAFSSRAVSHTCVLSRHPIDEHRSLSPAPRPVLQRPCHNSKMSTHPAIVFLAAGCPAPDASSRLFQRRHSHGEASTSGRHALPSRRDGGRCAASRVSGPQRAVTQAYSSFRRRMRNRPAQDKPTGVGSDDGSNEINPCGYQTADRLAPMHWHCLRDQAIGLCKQPDAAC